MKDTVYWFCLECSRQDEALRGDVASYQCPFCRGVLAVYDTLISREHARWIYEGAETDNERLTQQYGEICREISKMVKELQAGQPVSACCDELGELVTAINGLWGFNPVGGCDG